MRLFCIIRSKKEQLSSNTFKLLQNSAIKKGLEFVVIKSQEDNLAKLTNIKLRKDDLLYRVTTDEQSRFAELLLSRKPITNIYKNVKDTFHRTYGWGDEILMQNAGLQIIPTRFGVNSDEKQLEDEVKELGGFPVVLKVSGGSHGSGVSKYESIKPLMQAIKLAKNNENKRLALRKFIPNATHVRCVVLDGRTVDRIKYLPVEGDFRTNAVSVPSVISYNKDDGTDKLAEKVAKTLNYEFGGVDILIDELGVQYIAEINVPCNFSRNQINTGVDISGMIIDWLMEKSKNNH